MNPSYIFCGFMGCGKSRLGQLVAKKADVPFYDLDQLIEEKANCSIPTIFKKHGEAFFRTLEEEVLFDFLESMNSDNNTFILSLGGGALQNEQRIIRMKQYAPLVFIQVPFDALFDRLIRRKTRPLLLDDSGNLKPLKELYPFLETLYKKRLPLYKMANLVFSQNPTVEKEENANELFSLLYNLPK